MKSGYIRVAFIIIFDDKVLCVKKCYCAVVYPETPLRKNVFSCGDQSSVKKCTLIEFIRNNL